MKIQGHGLSMRVTDIGPPKNNDDSTVPKYLKLDHNWSRACSGKNDAKNRAHL